MGNSAQKQLADNFASQLKWAAKNRKADGRKKGDIVMSATEIAEVWQQIAFEYPFMETVSDSAIMTNHQLPDEPIVFCNDEFTQLTGYPKEEILGRNCRFLQGRHTDPKTVDAIRKAIKEGTRLELELLNYRKDGTPFINGFCMLPLHERGKKDGKVLYFLAIQKNVTVIVNPWRAPMEKWTIPEVSMWLEKHEAQGYIKGFLQKDISGAQLADMNSSKLNECGVVLSAEQTRLLRLIQASKGQQQRKADQQESSMGDDMSTSIQSTRVTVENSEDDDTMSERDTPSRREKVLGSSGKGATARKTAIQARFKDDARPPVSIIVSTASTQLAELRRVLRKKMGRKFQVQTMAAPNGLTSALAIDLDPTMDGLDMSNFAVLDGLSDPILVTDNVGLVVFANDRAWETLALSEDPGDTFIVNYLKIPNVTKLDYVSEMRSNRFQAALTDGSTFGVSVNPVTIGKCKLHVWALVQGGN